MSNDLAVFESIVRSASKRENTDGIADDQELDIRHFFLMVRRRRAFVLGTMAACFFLAVILCIFMKPRYRALGEIQVQKSATDGLGLDNLTGTRQPAGDSLEENVDLQTQAGILASDSLALKVVDDLHLESTDDFKQSFDPLNAMLDVLTPGASPDPQDASLEDAPRRRDHLVKVFEKHLKVEPKSGTRLIDIKYKSTDRKLAAAVVNDLEKSLVDYTLNSRYSATTEVSGWLSGQLADIKKEAELQQSNVEKLQRDSGVYSLGIPDASGKEMAYSAILDHLQQVTQELSNATSNRILKGALYKTIEHHGDPELISGLAGSSLAGTSPAVNNSFLLLQNLRTQQAALGSQLAADTSKFGPSYDKLVDEKAGLDSVNAQIKSEVVRIGQRVSNDYKAAQTTENSTREVYARARQDADAQNNKAMALLIARQEANDARSLYQTLSSHLKEAGVVEGLRSSNIAVVDPGRVPSRPIPYVLIIPALSLIIGGFVGIAGALMIESTSDRIEGMASIENSLHAPILAVLPIAQDSGVASKVRRTLGTGMEDSAIGRVAVLTGPNTAYVEAVRGLRTSLLQSQDGWSPKTILITSAGEQEGKSTLSLNLAAALVLNGSRVLLVDGDMRSSGLSGYMGFQRSSDAGRQKVGLSEALMNSGEPAVITPFSELPNLSALPAGSDPKYPAELLGSKRMQTLMSDWAADYDYVLIDSPPIFAVTDAVILSRLADITLLVARHGQTTKKSLERAYRTLSKVEGRNIGIVVNGVRRDSVSFGEFYGYQGSSYYSEA